MVKPAAKARGVGIEIMRSYLQIMKFAEKAECRYVCQKSAASTFAVV